MQLDLPRDITVGAKPRYRLAGIPPYLATGTCLQRTARTPIQRRLRRDPEGADSQAVRVEQVLHQAEEPIE